MGQAHHSTPEQRAQWTAYLIAHAGAYGTVAHIRRESGASRTSLYAWRQQGEQALLAAFRPLEPLPVRVTTAIERRVLTLWGDLTGSTRDIRTALQVLNQEGISLATVTDLLHTAQARALALMATTVPCSTRALALDESYANHRQGAYLHVVDVHSGAVWASAGPLAVDTESWTLVLWSLQDRGLQWDRVVLDGGAAARAGCRAVTPTLVIQGDQWHVLHKANQLRARAQRVVSTLERQTASVNRQVARIAAGKCPLGRTPQTDLAAHARAIAAARQTVADMQVLTAEAQRLLDVVVVDHRGLLDAAQRQADLDALVALATERVPSVPSAQRAFVRDLADGLRDQLPELLTFVAQVAAVQHDLVSVLPRERPTVLAWAWLRRKGLGWTSADILTAIPEAWRSAARLLLATWDAAVRVSTAVERWHSIMRPHLAVRRTMTSGMLALLAVWHNHRVFSRGIHKGKNPLQLSGITDAPTDWLVALGYPPAASTTANTTALQTELAMAA